MSMPDDVMATVGAAMDALVDACPWLMDEEQIIFEAVENAIRDERERCARIAEALAVEPDPDEKDPYDDYEMGGRSTARRLAAAIRNGVRL